MRLIDADKIGLTDFEILMCNGDYKQALNMLIDKIEKAPTAYDVDKVVKQLENEKAGYFEYGRSALYKAIEIVKAGGID